MGGHLWEALLFKGTSMFFVTAVTTCIPTSPEQTCIYLPELNTTLFVTLIHRPDILQTINWHHQDTPLQPFRRTTDPSRYPPDILQTPSRYLTGAFQTSLRHHPDTILPNKRSQRLGKYFRSSDIIHNNHCYKLLYYYVHHNIIHNNHKERKKERKNLLYTTMRVEQM